MSDFQQNYRTWFDQKEYSYTTTDLGIHEIDPQGCNVIEFYIDDWAATLGVLINQQRTIAGWNTFKSPDQLGFIDQKMSLRIPPIGATILVKRTFTAKGEYQNGRA